MAIGIFAEVSFPQYGVSPHCAGQNDNAQAPASGRNVCNTTQHNTKSSDVAADEMF